MKRGMRKDILIKEKGKTGQITRKQELAVTAYKKVTNRARQVYWLQEGENIPFKG